MNNLEDLKYIPIPILESGYVAKVLECILGQKQVKEKGMPLVSLKSHFYMYTQHELMEFIPGNKTEEDFYCFLSPYSDVFGIDSVTRYIP